MRTGVPRLEPASGGGLAGQQGRVEQDRARDDPVAQRVNAARRTAARLLDRRQRRAGMAHAVNHHVAVERVQVAMGVAVVAAGVLQSVRAARLARAQHFAVQDRRGVDRLLLDDVVRQRDGDPLLHERRRPPAFVRRDEVGRADLVVRAPAALVGQLPDGALHVGRGLHALVRLAVGPASTQSQRNHRDRRPAHHRPDHRSHHAASRVHVFTSARRRPDPDRALRRQNARTTDRRQD